MVNRKAPGILPSGHDSFQTRRVVGKARKRRIWPILQQAGGWWTKTCLRDDVPSEGCPWRIAIGSAATRLPRCGVENGDLVAIGVHQAAEIARLFGGGGQREEPGLG